MHTDCTVQKSLEFRKQKATAQVSQSKMLSASLNTGDQEQQLTGKVMHNTNNTDRHN